MPGDIRISVDVSEVDRYLSAIGDAARVKAITRKALRKGAQITQSAVEELAPERPDLPSGTALPVGALKADIVIRSYTDQNGREVASVQPGALTDHVAGWVEYGHRLVSGGYSKVNAKTGKTSGPGKEAGQVPAHPFFRPAAEASEDAAAAAIVASLSEDAVKENAPTGNIEAA